MPGPEGPCGKVQPERCRLADLLTLDRGSQVTAGPSLPADLKMSHWQPPPPKISVPSGTNMACSVLYPLLEGL